MSIPAKHQGRYVYHMTHIDNLASIIEHGLLCTKDKDSMGIKHQNLAYQDIQDRRSKKTVTCPPGGCVHDYVPFYFCSKSPMLYGQLMKKNVDQNLIIFLAVPIDILDQPDVIFTDFAANANNDPNFYTDPIHLDKLEWQYIDALGYIPREKYPQRMAEVLIHQKLDFSRIEFIVTYNDYSKNILDEILSSNGASVKTRFGDYYPNTTWAPKGIHHYYTRYRIEGEKNQTIVIGPRSLLSAYNQLIIEVSKNLDPSLKFSSIDAALIAIDSNPKELPELKALADLMPSKKPHWENILAHSVRVVSLVKNLNNETEFTPDEKNCLVLAAYLHDIGKVKSPRNDEGKCEPDPNHAYRGIELLARIFTEEILLTEPQLALVCKLVVYDDLIGEVIGKGRHKEQIIQVAHSMREFDLLATICRADVQSLIQPGNGFSNRLANRKPREWLQNIEQKLPELRTWVEQKLEEQDNA